MQREDRWAGNPRPRRGQPRAWARGPCSHLWKRGCSPSLTEKPARPEPLAVRERGPLQGHASPTCAPPSWAGPALQAGELRETQKHPNATLPPAARDRARGTGPEAVSRPEFPGADGRWGHVSSCCSGRRPGKAAPCWVQRQAALTGRGCNTSLRLSSDRLHPEVHTGRAERGRDGARPRRAAGGGGRPKSFGAGLPASP